jgi:hypothetical protein
MLSDNSDFFLHAEFCAHTDLPAGKPISLPRLSKPYQQAQLQAEIEKLLSLAYGGESRATLSWRASTS